FQSEPGSGVGALDQPGQVRHDERDILPQFDDAQHGLQGGEGVVANLRPGRAGRGQQRRFAGVGKPNQAGIGDQLQLQPQPTRFPRLPQLGEARGLTGGGLEAGVTPPAPPPAADDEPLVCSHEIRDRLPLLVLDERARRDLQDQVVRVSAVAPAAAAAPSTDTCLRPWPVRSKRTTPSTSANRVWSRPMPTLDPGKIAVPRWRSRMVPALTSCPAPVFIPSRWPTLSRPLRELPAPFLCAMPYSCVVVFASAATLRRPRRAPATDRSPALGRAAGAGRSPAAGREAVVPSGAWTAPMR